MALNKETVIDKIEILGERRTVQWRTATVIKEDGNELSRSFHRDAVSSVESTYADGTWTHDDTDISSLPTEIQQICGVVWTDAVKTLTKQAHENDGV